MGAQDNQAFSTSYAHESSIISLVREASYSFRADEWGTLCLGALAQLAEASVGLLLDSEGAPLASMGLDDLESYELATSFTNDRDEALPTAIRLGRRDLTVGCIPLLADSRRMGVALLAGGDDPGFASRLVARTHELKVLGSALSAGSPW